MQRMVAALGRGVLIYILGIILVTAYAQTFRYLPEMETVELSPQIRVEPYSATIYKVNTDDIYKFLQNILMFESVDQYEMLPYIIGFDEMRSMVEAGQIAYTKGLKIRSDVTEYTLLIPGRALTHPITGEDLGVQAFNNGRAVVKEFGDPQTILVTEALSSVAINSRLTPLVGIDMPVTFDVKYPDKKMFGYIVSVLEDHGTAGAYSLVVVSLGKRDGVLQGNVLDLSEPARTFTDPNTDRDVKLPIVKIGEVLIYKVMQKVSLGIITYSNRVILPGDKVSVLNTN